MYFWLANLVVALHATAIFINVAGMLGLVTGRWRIDGPWTRRHTAFALVAAGTLLSLLVHGRCVLTTWENQLRELDRAGSAYGGPFVAEYAPWVPAAVAQYSVLLLVAAAIGGAVYWRAIDFVRGKRSPRQLSPDAEPGAAGDGGA